MKLLWQENTGNWVHWCSKQSQKGNGLGEKLCSGLGTMQKQSSRNRTDGGEQEEPLPQHYWTTATTLPQHALLVYKTSLRPTQHSGLIGVLGHQSMLWLEQLTKQFVAWLDRIHVTMLFGEWHRLMANWDCYNCSYKNCLHQSVRKGIKVSLTWFGHCRN